MTQPYPRSGYATGQMASIRRIRPSDAAPELLNEQYWSLGPAARVVRTVPMMQRSAWQPWPWRLWGGGIQLYDAYGPGYRYAGGIDGYGGWAGYPGWGQIGPWEPERGYSMYGAIGRPDGGGSLPLSWPGYTWRGHFSRPPQQGWPTPTAPPWGPYYGHGWSVPYDPMGVPTYVP